MNRARIGLLAAVLALPAAAAQDLVIYRCVAADGQVLLQNTARCPEGMRQERRVLERPAPAPVPPRAAPALPRPVAGDVVAVPPASSGTTARPPATTAPGASPTAGTASAASAAPTVDASAALRPAPALMSCRTREGESYFSDEAVPSRCVPLRTVGLDGRTASAGEACERVFDDCEPVPEATRCAGFAEYRRQAEGVATFQPDRAGDARAVLERIDAAVGGTVCGR